MVIGSNVLRGLSIGQVGPASIDVELADVILVPSKQKNPIKLGDKVPYKLIRFSKTKPFYLRPGAFVLAATKQYFQFPSDVCGFVQGRSSIGRIGLTVQNAGFIDPGFYGTITLELVNESKNWIALIPDYRIAQIVMLDVRDNDLTYDGKYNGQIKPTASRMNMDVEARG